MLLREHISHIRKSVNLINSYKVQNQANFQRMFDCVTQILDVCDVIKAKTDNTGCPLTIQNDQFQPGGAGNCPWQQLQEVAYNSWRSADKRPVALQFITGRIGASHRDISVLVQLPGQYPAPPGRNCPLSQTVPGVVHSNSGRRLLFYSSWRSADKRPVALPFITGRFQISLRPGKP